MRNTEGGKVGKTVVSSQIIDRVAAKVGENTIYSSERSAKLLQIMEFCQFDRSEKAKAFFEPLYLLESQAPPSADEVQHAA